MELDWPALPETDATVAIPAQEWAYRPGPRAVVVHVRYPDGRLDRVGPRTGLILTLHNWGGTGFAGAPDPQVLASRFDLVAIGVDYLQSGEEGVRGPEPYDFGYLQALDAIRALFLVHDALCARRIAFDAGRIFAAGGSGGGNVSLMANKLAPRTFAAVIDLCGMAKLSREIAFGAGALNARYSPATLTTDVQELRFVGHPGHLATMRRLGNRAKVVVVHGVEDMVCPYGDAKEMVENLQAARFSVDWHPITPARCDGLAFTSAAHPLGDRTKIVERVAGAYLDPASPSALRRRGRPDFARRDMRVRYETAGGAFVIDYRAGYPIGRFVPRPLA